MKRWLLSGLVVGLVVAHASTAVGQSLVGETTMAEWYRWSSDGQVLWVSGARGAFSLLGIACAAPPTVGSVADAMRQRDLAGTWKGTDKAIGGVIVVMADHGCNFESEEILTAVNAILKTLKEIR